MHNQKIISYFENLQHVGNIENPTCSFMLGSIKEEKVAKLDISIENNIISNIKFKAFANPALIVSLEYICRKLYRSSISEKITITSDEIISFFNFNSIEQINAIISLDLLHNTLSKLKK